MTVRNAARVWAAGLVVGAVVVGSAAGAADTGKKKELISRLIELSSPSEIEGQMAEQQSDVELMNIHRSYDEMMDFAVSEQTQLSEEDRKKLRERLDSFDSFAEKFRSMFIARLDFAKIIDTVYRPLYDRYFTEEDLAAMVAFYSTPVGRKTIEYMPTLMQEAGAGIERIVRPEAVKIIQDIVAAEVARFGKK